MIDLNKKTSGYYICKAENGIGNAIEKRIQIQINGKLKKKVIE